MNQNYFVRCNVCNTFHRVRIQAGYLNHYPVRFYCAECGSRICGEVHLRPEQAAICFDLKPGTCASIENEIPHEAYLVECSGELVTRKMQKERLTDLASICSTNPFFEMVNKVSFHELQKYINQVQQCLFFYENRWEKVRISLSLFHEGKQPYAAKMIEECESELHMVNNSKLSPLERISRLEQRSLPMLINDATLERAKEMQLRTQAIDNRELTNLALFYENRGGLAGLLSESLDAFNQFATCFPYLLGAFAYRLANEDYDLHEYGCNTCTVEDIADLYRDAYETLGKHLIFLLGLDNIVRCGHYDILPNCLPAKSFEKLFSVAKGKLFDCVGTGNTTELLRKCWNPDLRNALSHSGYKVDPLSQTIHVVEKDGSIQNEKDVWLLDMMCQCIDMLRELFVANQAIYAVKALVD